jgi:hypothetical protein
MDPTKCYAVCSGEYSDYRIHAIYRRRETAEARVRANNAATRWLLDGNPVDDWDQLPKVERRSRIEGFYVTIDHERVQTNPARESRDEMRVEEFDYYEGEPLPAPLEG